MTDLQNFETGKSKKWLRWLVAFIIVAAFIAAIYFDLLS